MILSSALAMAALTSSSTTSPYDAREQDWRNGALVYQIFVDRFFAATPIEQKANLYPSPKTRKVWTDLPKAGRLDSEIGSWTHELEFWGGDLKGIEQKLDYVKSLNADVLYLTPIFAANTNHKYDTQNYFEIAPEFGTIGDFKSLLKSTHKQEMKLMLDGVFNHCGRTSPFFLEIYKDYKHPKRDWFNFGEEFPTGYRAWVGVPNLPAWNLENREVRDYLWNNKDSVVRHWLKEGIDGWRLDVAFELGPDYLVELTKAAQNQRKGSAVIGEISGYPSSWQGAVDGVFNFMAPNLIISACRGEMSGGKAGRLLNQMKEDAGIDHLLKSWLHLDNHDTPRIASVLPKSEDRKLAWAALMTLPGSPVVYYGSELGLPGAGDPANRAPMDWTLVNEKNPDYTWFKQLSEFRTKHRALKIGDFTVLETDSLIAYTRTTDKLRDSVMVLINPTDKPVTETFTTRMGRILSWGEFEDAWTKERFRSITGMATVTLPAKSVRLFTPVTAPVGGVSMYDRIP